MMLVEIKWISFDPVSNSGISRQEQKGPAILYSLSLLVGSKEYIKGTGAQYLPLDDNLL